MSFLDSINPFRKLAAMDIVKTNLEDYERLLVIQEAAAAYHFKMAEYYREGIQCLKKQIK
ncbi:MAG: hypothetical protein ACD_85C00001G0009 [uncultured bacterium]|nr:MAG: hypothetical protein ACD_85C00001G0009 [uncultured bacterium]